MIIPSVVLIFSAVLASAEKNLHLSRLLSDFRSTEFKLV